MSDQFIEAMSPQEMVDKCREHGGIMTSTFVEVSITEHPDFYKCRNDWGVIRAYWCPGYYDEHTDEYIDDHDVPEDRSGYMPEHDGKSLADFWDDEAGEFKPDTPVELIGVKTFMKPVYKYSAS